MEEADKERAAGSESGENTSNSNSESNEASKQEEGSSEGTAGEGTSATTKSLTGYLVAVGDGGGYKCRVGGEDYEDYSAADGATDGDACSITVNET